MQAKQGQTWTFGDCFLKWYQDIPGQHGQRGHCEPSWCHSRKRFFLVLEGLFRLDCHLLCPCHGDWFGRDSPFCHHHLEHLGGAVCIAFHLPSHRKMAAVSWPTLARAHRHSCQEKSRVREREGHGCRDVCFESCFAFPQQFLRSPCFA